MSAEGKPQTPPSSGAGSLVAQPLKLLTVLVARFPISVIVISALLVALSLTGAQLSLDFRTSRSDLLNPKSENNRRWVEFTQEFGEQDDVTVVVHGQDPKAVPPVLDDLAAQAQSRAQTLPLDLPQVSTSPSSSPRASTTTRSACKSSSRSTLSSTSRRASCRATSPR